MLMLIMFFIIALLSGVLTSRIKRQEMKIRIREERTNALYQLTRELSTATGIEEVIDIAKNDIKKYFNLNSRIILKNDANQLDYTSQKDTNFNLSKNDMSVAEWTFQHSAKAGRHTDTLPSANYTFYPLKGNQMNLRSHCNSTGKSIYSGRRTILGGIYFPDIRKVRKGISAKYGKTGLSAK